jgi:ribosome-associated protein
MTPEEVAALLADRGLWTYSRASGPGGQRRDHAETRAELTIRREDLEGIAGPLAERLAARLRLDRRPLRLSSQTDRSRERNREIVLARLERRVAEALAPPAPPRRPTRPSRASAERRLAQKARRASVKEGRRRPDPDG